jgi:hypothetical protein
MKKIILTTFTLLFLNTVCAQFEGERTKNPYTAIDTHTYKVGDEITIGIPKKGKKYAWIYYYEYVSTLEQGANVLSFLTGGSNNAKIPKFEPADEVIKGFKAKILFFKTVEIENKKIMFAVVNYKDTYRLDIPIENSLISKELVSLNPQYTATSETKIQIENTLDEMIVKSFDPNFNVKVLSITGDKNEQTVKITFLISHKLAHQQVCLIAKDYRLSTSNDAKMYDLEGITYSSKYATIGVNEDSGTVCDKIPTNIPVKSSVTFKQILPTVKEFNFMSLGVVFRPFDSDRWSDKEGNIEITNLKVDWK